MTDYRKSLGPTALLMTGIGSIIGSGWLFGAQAAAGSAGPAAILAWVIGAVVIGVIGLSYVELGAMFPRSGGMVRYAHYSHGALAGYLGGWANWVAIVSVIPVEAVASIQYMSSWDWQWARDLTAGGELSTTGLVLSAVLVVFYFLINYWTVSLFAHANGFITIIKLVIPAVTAVGLIAVHFSIENFTSHGGFAPFGWSGVLTAVATSGVVFAFNGFQSPINLAGEARNPGRDIPRAVLGSIAVAAVLYVLLQIAFLGAIPASALANGWASIGQSFQSPFANLLMIWGLQWLALTLFADAVVSPAGTGMTYTATTARMIQGMQENGYFPKIFGRLHPRFGVPRPAMWLNLAVSCGFLFAFRGWGSLASIISVATIISYVTGPVSLMVLRRTGAELHRPLRLPYASSIAPIGFALASLMLYWARWPLTGQVILIVVAGMPLYLYYQWKAGFAGFGDQLRSGAWLPAYLVGIATLSWLGSEQFGGQGLIPYGVDMALVVLSSMCFYNWGVRSGQGSPSLLAELLEQRDRKPADAVAQPA